MRSKCYGRRCCRAKWTRNIPPRSEALAEGVNACLSERLEVVPDKRSDLLAALGAYYRALAASSGEETAYLEMLLRASTSVAQFLRQHKDELSAAVEEPTAATGEETEG